MSDMSLIRKSATEILALLSRDEISPLDLLEALETRVAEVEPKINALPTLCFERARNFARALMAKPREERGTLLGMPVAIKDLEEVKGVRTTFGSPIFANHISDRSDIVVETLEKNGGVVYAKSNTPEFGAGGNTFNEVLGTTLNPGTWSAALPGLPVALRLRWHPGQHGWRRVRILVARFVTRPVFVPLLACGQARPGCARARWYTLCHSAGCGTDGAECGRCGVDAGCHDG